MKIKNRYIRAAPSEQQVHLAFCKYIQMCYPSVIFTSESSGVRLRLGQAVRAKQLRSGNGLPDVWILEPRGGYAGMMLELKKSEGQVYKKNGDFLQDAHVLEQARTLEKLRALGYWAWFACGIDHAIAILDEYMKFPKLKTTTP